jgi:trk system potassium uptake protein
LKYLHSKIIRRVIQWLNLLTVLVVVVDLGFVQTTGWENVLQWYYLLILTILAAGILMRYLEWRPLPPLRIWLFDVLLVGAVIYQIYHLATDISLDLESGKLTLHLVLIIALIRELALLQINFPRRRLNPAQLFILSFMLLIFLGTALLMLPRATYSGISLVDALFTSTSAVCVTGLIVVDTATYFTRFGQSIIMLLIQLGGLGIMTFASYFSYFFKGGTSYESQLMLKDMTNVEKIADVLDTLRKIITLTIFIEAIGILFIYISLDETIMPSVSDRLYFSIFHGVSGFCNAGFSTLTNNMFEDGYRFNYPFQITIALLFILGGTGFPILFNIYRYLKHLVINQIRTITRKGSKVHVPWVININTRIVFLTTVTLIIVGTVLIFAFEYGNILEDHQGYGKIVTAFFTATTPRTAGFNTVDMNMLQLPTVMLIFLLMWIGASPASTGGGIKTSTFALGTLNFLSLAKGKDRIEVFGREIADHSVRRAFAVMALSLVVIGTSIFLLTNFDGDHDLISIAFESFSAYSTVGLSLGITGDLSNAGKLVIVFTMFIGRVSMLTLLIALFRRVKDLKYRYPVEEVLIN